LPPEGRGSCHHQANRRPMVRVSEKGTAPPPPRARMRHLHGRRRPGQTRHPAFVLPVWHGLARRQSTSASPSECAQAPTRTPPPPLSACCSARPVPVPVPVGCASHHVPCLSSSESPQLLLRRAAPRFRPREMFQARSARSPSPTSKCWLRCSSQTGWGTRELGPAVCSGEAFVRARACVRVCVCACVRERRQVRPSPPRANWKRWCAFWLLMAVSKKLRRMPSSTSLWPPPQQRWRNFKQQVKGTSRERAHFRLVGVQHDADAKGLWGRGV